MNLLLAILFFAAGIIFWALAARPLMDRIAEWLESL